MKTPRPQAVRTSIRRALKRGEMLSAEGLAKVVGHDLGLPEEYYTRKTWVACVTKQSKKLTS